MNTYQMKLLSRNLVESAVINSKLEDYHSGITPSSKKGDYSDVKVVSPYGEIPWKDLSRISDKEMRKLMLDIEKKMYYGLIFITKLLEGKKVGIKKDVDLKKYLEILKEHYANGVSWDRKYGKMFVRNFKQK